MRPISFSLLLIASLSGCETSTDPFTGIGGGGGGGGAVTQAQTTGNWSFTLRRTSTLPCTGGALATGQVITAHIDVLSDGGVSPATSSWQSPANASVRPLSGSIRFSDGRTVLIFGSTGASTTSGMELVGFVTASGAFTGTMTDPAPGLTPVFGTGGCEYATTGTKTS